jgi:hypothetical protein
MNPHISTAELHELAAVHSLTIQHECGGYRVVEANGGSRRDVFPNSGICPVVARLACYIFLLGVDYGRKGNGPRDNGPLPPLHKQQSRRLQ